MQEIAGQAAALERDFDDLDLHAAERNKAMKALDRRAIDVERWLVLGRAKTLAHLVILACPQVKRRGRLGVTGRGVALGMGTDFVGDLDASVKPRRVIAGSPGFQQAPYLVNFAHVGAAPRRRTQHAEDRRGPAVVAGKI